MISSASPLGLGSASPRRRALLEQLGIPVFVVTANIDERRRPSEDHAAYLERITREKLIGVAADDRARLADVLLVADTVVVTGGEILGKPANEGEAHSMIERLSGRSHEVRTRFALGRPGPAGASIVHAETVTTLVQFRPLAAEEIRNYVATGEGTDKAGGYAIQGVGSFAVSRIEGSYANVVGLPVCEVVVALQRHGFLGPFP
ncbi:MAG TPA: Maf family protein [Polyangiaceae bacterium]|nr:Maf family protein [Polyangiaceae bacterium]